MRLTQTALASAAPALPLASTMRRKSSARPRPKPPSIGSSSSPKSPATPWPANPLECTGFSVEVLSHRSLDLTIPPLANPRVWRHPVEYGPCQDLANAARKAGAEILRYASARDPGVCVAVLVCGAFAEASPKGRETWRIGVGQSGAYALREFPEARLEFGRDAFAADPRIAAMQWER